MCRRLSSVPPGSSTRPSRHCAASPKGPVRLAEAGTALGTYAIDLAAMFFASRTPSSPSSPTNSTPTGRWADVLGGAVGSPVSLTGWLRPERSGTAGWWCSAPPAGACRGGGRLEVAVWLVLGCLYWRSNMLSGWGARPSGTRPASTAARSPASRCCPTASARNSARSAPERWPAGPAPARRSGPADSAPASPRPAQPAPPKLLSGDARTDEDAARRRAAAVALDLAWSWATRRKIRCSSPCVRHRPRCRGVDGGLSKAGGTMRGLRRPAGGYRRGAGGGRRRGGPGLPVPAVEAGRRDQDEALAGVVRPASSSPSCRLRHRPGPVAERGRGP